MAGLSTSEVKALLDAERSDSLSALSASKLSEERAKALDYYNGDMADDMPSLPDRSSAVSTDVADAVEGLMPSLMEIFAGGDRIVDFEPVGQEDEEAAQQETDYVNHVLMKDNNGFLVIHDFVKDGLLSKNGYVKVWWDEGERQERLSWKGLTDDAWALIQADETLTVESHKAYLDDTGEDAPSEAPPEGIPPPPMAGAAPGGGQAPPALPMPPQMGGMAPPAPEGPDAMGMPPMGLPAIPAPPIAPGMLHDVVARKVESYGCVKIENVPPEEFGISRRAKRIEDATYCFQETETTEQDLIDEGFDEDQVRKLPTGDIRDTEEQEARNTVDDTDDGEGQGTQNRSSRPLRVLEEYVRMDYDGKGSKLYRVTRGGAQAEILTRDGEPAVEEVDEIPFASVSPIRMPHRHYGKSVADVVMDIQRIKTALTRNMLDNIYLANNQRIEVAETHANANTIDDLLNNRPGSMVRTKQPGGLIPIPNQPIGDFVMPMVQMLDARLEQRTGVTKQGQGLDPNALQNIGENAILDGANAARARTKFIARVMAEGIKDLCQLVHSTIRKNAQKAATVRLKNKWVEVDPRGWKARNDVTVTVGLGSGSKEQQLNFLMGVLGIQKELKAMGSSIASDGNVYNTLEKLVETGGLRNVEPYFTDPKNAPPQQPRPDPKMIEAEGKLKIAAAEGQAKQQLEQQKAQSDLQLAIAKMQEEAKLEREKAAEEARQSQQQQEAEFALRLREMAAEHQLEMVRMRMQTGVQLAGNQTKERIGIDANERKANLTAVRPGGKVG